MSNADSAREDLQIRQRIADQHAAICRKDVAGVMSHYADDAVIFNVKPPFQTRNRAGWREIWETSLAHFPSSFSTETKDLQIVVSGSLAIAHYLYRFTGLPGKQSWIRNTAAYRNFAGQWLIVHEHYSVPFNPETSKAVFEF
jgi:ketosteroid isomerase-like protein